MHLDLEELRAQRELLLRHLGWLDSKIEKLEAEEGTAKVPEELSGLPKPPPPNAPGPAKTVPAAEPLAGDTPAPDALPIPGAGSFRAQSASEIKRARFGCLFIFFAACGLFLFLLFGLPYLIDSDGAEADAVEESTR